MTSAFRFRGSLSVVLLGSALLLFGFGSAAAATTPPFDGAWACSSSLDHSPISSANGNGSITSLGRLVISGGSVTSFAYAAVELGSQELVVTSTSTGTFTPQTDGFALIKSTLVAPPNTEITVQCIGMTQVKKAYQEMHCMDLTQGDSQVSITICKRQVASGN